MIRACLRQVPCDEKDPAAGQILILLELTHADFVVHHFSRTTAVDLAELCFCHRRDTGLGSLKLRHGLLMGDLHLQVLNLAFGLRHKSDELLLVRFIVRGQQQSELLTAL